MPWAHSFYFTASTYISLHLHGTWHSVGHLEMPKQWTYYLIKYTYHGQIIKYVLLVNFHKLSNFTISTTEETGNRF